MKAYLLKTHTQILLPYIFTALHIIYTNTNTEVMQVKSVYISVNAQHFELKYLSQNSGINSVVSPNAHHLALSGSLSQAKWCTIRALYQPADFLHISSHTHTHTLSLSLTHPPGLCQHMYHCQHFSFLSYASVLPLGQQPSAKPISKCCLHHPTFVAILMSGHFNFLFLGRFKVQMLKVKPRSWLEEAHLWHRMGNVVTKGNSKLIFMNNAQPFVYCWVYGDLFCLSLDFSSWP